MPRILSNEQIAQYERDGFLVFENLLTEPEVEALLARVEKVVEAPPAGVRVQVEPLVAKGVKQTATSSKMDAVRKIEGLVEHDDLFLALARHPNLLHRMQDLLGENVRMFRDALMMKPPRVGSEKPYHQDSAYWRIEPMNLCSAWIALDDATLENGCMRVLRGSHKLGVLEHKHIRDFQVDESTLDLSEEVNVPLTRGSALFFHSLLLHATSDNLSEMSRRGMIVSCMGAENRYTGPAGTEPNWLVLSA